MIERKPTELLVICGVIYQRVILKPQTFLDGKAFRLQTCNTDDVKDSYEKCRFYNSYRNYFAATSYECPGHHLRSLHRVGTCRLYNLSWTDSLASQ